MPGPEQVIENLKGPGLLVVKEDKRYFIPLADLAQYLLPKDFQIGGTQGVSNEYFEISGGTPEQLAALATAEAPVARYMEEMLGQFWVADGVRQAVFLDFEILPNGRHVSKAVGSKKVLFSFNAPGTKILVDGTRGARPSIR